MATGIVLRIISDSLPAIPTTVAAATTFITHIMLPAFAPIPCSANTRVWFMPILSATLYCRLENIMLEKVAEPDRKAPKIPTIGAIHAHTAPIEWPNMSANATGIEARPEPLAPEFRKIFTIGTEAPSEIIVGNIDLHEMLIDCLIAGLFILNRKKPMIHTATKNAPGAYKVAKLALSSVPIKPVQLILKLDNQAVNGATVRDNTSRAAIMI